jgi:tetratricopeptide (TPR) repeat protein
MEEQALNRKTNHVLLLALLASALSLTTAGCGVVNKLRAKNSLNEGVREFNKGKYQTAEEKFSQALELSPELTNAQLYYAQAIKAQFDQALSEDLGKKTIAAYDNVISKNQGNDTAIDQALAYKANIYDQLTRVNPAKAAEFKQLQRETLEKRANLPSATAKTKADVYYTLGVSYWKESYDLNAGYFAKHQPIPPDVLQKMKPLAQKAHEYLQKAISVDPNYANAWFYEKLVYIEDAKTDPGHLKDYDAKAKVMQEKYIAMQKQQQQQAASEAAPAK